MAKKDIKKLQEIQAKPAVDISVKDFLHEYMLPYAYYTIQDRALIGEDGLKPVNRRLLYTMHISNVKRNKFMKAGTVASRTMGDFHPHGNTSIEAALARLGQTFAMRVPLIEVIGSVGSETGDSPAAARYWEASLSKAGELLVEDVDNKSVPMTRNYTDKLDEPVKLPIKWPVGIINGTSGIATGFASEIYPHNPTEVMNACIATLKGKVNSVKSLMKYMPGPDFPTGGELVGVDAVEEYYTNGSGTFTVRGKYKVEEESRGRTRLIFYELPFQVSAEQVRAAIDKAQDKGHLKDVSESRDLSDLENGLQLAIMLKSGANVINALKELWKFTPCQSKFSVNSTVLVNSKPTQNYSMLNLIQQFINFRKDCSIRSAKFKIEKLNADIHKLDGILSILVDLDKAISIIRKSETAEDASNKLIKTFKITDEQAKHILAMQLRSLTKADSEEIYSKQRALTEEKRRLEELVSNENVLNETLIKEFEQTKKIIGDDRRTTITSISNEALKAEEKAQEKLLKSLAKGVDVYVKLDTATKTVTKSFEPNGGVKASSTGNVFFLTDTGSLIEAAVESIGFDPTKVNTAAATRETISAVVVSEKDEGVVIATNFGNVGIIKTDKIKHGHDATKLLPLEKIIYAQAINRANAKQVLAFISADGKILPISLDKLRFAGAGSGLVAGFKCETSIVGASIVPSVSFITTYTAAGEIKTTDAADCPIKGRGGGGYVLHKLLGADKITRFEVSEAPIADSVTARGKRGAKK